MKKGLVPRRVWAVALVGLTWSCATNPATGRRELMVVSEQQEIQMGRQAHEEIVGAYGLLPDQAVRSYVARIGGALAAASERPGLPWTFEVLDDPVVNAFALPGGFIYLTRGMMTYLNSEAELAAVLGHEIGHVTARHSAAQISRAQLATLGLGIGMIIEPELQRLGDVAQAGVGLLFLKFGRDDEREADELGLRYMAGQQYRPEEMADVFQTLQRLAPQEGRLPAWLSTHPSPEDRTEKIRAEIARTGAAGSLVRRREYLARIDGMVFGPNPREGFFQGTSFYHPDLRFRLTFPQGWTTANLRQVVRGLGPGNDAALTVTLTDQRSAEEALRGFVSQAGLRAGGAQRRQVNGLPAASASFEAALQGGGAVAGRAVFVELGGRVYRLLAYATSTAWPRVQGVLDQSLLSFAPLTDARYLGVQPQRIDLVTVDRAATAGQIAARHPSPAEPETLALLNGAPAGGTLPAGVAKWVVGERLPGAGAAP